MAIIGRDVAVAEVGWGWTTWPRRALPRSSTDCVLDRVAAELNNRPRQTLGWLSPSEALDEALR
jgi:hypothetical protein